MEDLIREAKQAQEQGEKIRAKKKRVYELSRELPVEEGWELMQIMQDLPDETDKLREQIKTVWPKMKDFITQGEADVENAEQQIHDLKGDKEAIGTTIDLLKAGKIQPEAFQDIEQEGLPTVVFSHEMGELLAMYRASGELQAHRNRNDEETVLDENFQDTTGIYRAAYIEEAAKENFAANIPQSLSDFKGYWGQIIESIELEEDGVAWEGKK